MFCASVRSGGASSVPVMQNMKTGTECIEKQSAHQRVQRRTQNSTPPTHLADWLADNQSGWSYSWHTTNQSIRWLRRPTANVLSWAPTQLNTPNRFVPEVSPNASDGQRLARRVSGFRTSLLHLWVVFHAIFVRWPRRDKPNTGEGTSTEIRSISLVVVCSLTSRCHWNKCAWLKTNHLIIIT